jgi:hypothetical protein
VGVGKVPGCMCQEKGTQSLNEFCTEFHRV